MTERLYYKEASLLRFEARAIEVGYHDGMHFTVLDRSAFYPTSGGQLFDTGLLNGIAIIDVIERGENVLHLSRSPVASVKDLVVGEVDSARRTAHRQLHTAQHLLSAVIANSLGAETVSVHLGQDYGGVELQMPEISDAQIQEVENSVNAHITQSLPISILFVTEQESQKLPLRKPPARAGELRVIRIGDLDWSACGGTHCSTTAEVCLVKLIGSERVRGRVLLKFLAGARAFSDYKVRFEVTQGLSRSLTCGLTDIPVKIDKLMDEIKLLRTDIERLYAELLPVYAQRLTEKKKIFGSTALLTDHISGLDAKNINTIATLSAEAVHGIAMLYDGNRVVIGAAGTSKTPANELARHFCSLSGLRGGGNSVLAQLGGVDEPTFRNLVSHAENYFASL